MTFTPQIENNSDFTTVEIEDELDLIIEGLVETAQIITSTMGGAGRNVILNSPKGLTFTKDGVSVAKYINLPDPIKNIGCKLLINATNKTVEQCGDGTTLTALLTKEMVNEMRSANEPINEVIDGMDAFVINVEANLKSRSKQIEDVQDIFEIAKTSAKSPSIGNLFKEIYAATGFGAHITLETSEMSNTTYYELTKGLHFENGYVNTRFANQDNGSCILDDCMIILGTEVLSKFEEYVKILGEQNKQNKSVLFIAPGYSDNFIQNCVTNKERNGVKICLVKSPGYAKGVEENYRDIAAFSNEGFVDRVVITPYDFTIFNDPDLEILNKRVSQLQKKAESAVEEWDAQNYLDRIVRLKQTSAVIYVGGVTSKNAKEEYDRIEDAIGAVSSAFKLGYVRGAGCELADISFYYPPGSRYSQILRSALDKIVSNANIDKPVKTDKPFNVISKQYDDTIIDPTYVLVCSLQNANALAKLLINTSYALHNQ